MPLQKPRIRRNRVLGQMQRLPFVRLELLLHGCIGQEAAEAGGEEEADYLESGESGDDMFLIEECSDADEARWLAERYDAIIGKILGQMEGQF